MKIAVISPSAKNLENIGRYLAGAGQSEPTLVEGGLSRLRTIVDQDRPDLAIVECMCRDADELGPLEYVTQHHPQTMVMMLCAHQTPEFLINAMRAGVREVLPSPTTREALQAAVARAAAKRGAAHKPQAPGKVLAFIACKGGSGATFLSTNLAHQLSLGDKRVLLIDLNLQFGDAVLYVHDRRPATNLADISRNIERLDASFLAASLVHVRSNFGMLAAPEDPGQAMEIKPEHIETLLTMAVRQYDFVILDVGRALDAVTLRALDRSNRIFPVLQTTLPFVRDAARLLSVFRSLGYPQDRIGLVVNRHGTSEELTLADIEQSLGLKVVRTVPNSYAAVAASVNRGVPIEQLARSNPVTRSLDEFAQSLQPRSEPSGGWLGRLLKRA